jgi:hypothetical protein
MRDIAPLYGKVYHFWQVDRGDQLPMGPPQLMGSFTSEERVKKAHPEGLKGLVAERDARFNVNHEQKAEKRKDIEPVEKHPGMSIGIVASVMLGLVSIDMLNWCCRCRRHVGETTLSAMTKYCLPKTKARSVSVAIVSGE